jgi:hypothetical protein
VARAGFLGFFEGRESTEEADVAGPIVMTDSDAERIDDAYGPRSRGISPRGRS